MKPLPSLLRLVLFVSTLACLHVAALACGSGSAYTRVANVADKLQPALAGLLQTAERVHPLPGGAQALEATERLLDAWAASDADRFNEAAPCAREAFRAAALASSMAGEEALSMRLEQAAELLGSITGDAACPPRALRVPPAPSSDADAGPHAELLPVRAHGRALAHVSFPLASHGAIAWA